MLPTGSYAARSTALGRASGELLVFTRCGLPASAGLAHASVDASSSTRADHSSPRAILITASWDRS